MRSILEETTDEQINESLYPNAMGVSASYATLEHCID